LGRAVVSTLGSTGLSVVYPLLILAITDSVAAAGIASGLRSVPYLIFSLPVGALIDRWNRRRVMIWCDWGRALAALSVPIALWLDALTIGQIYVVAFVEGSLFVFSTSRRSPRCRASSRRVNCPRRRHKMRRRSARGIRLLADRSP
jgi:MFS family permease